MPGAIYSRFRQPTTVHLLKMLSKKVYIFQPFAAFLDSFETNLSGFSNRSVCESAKLGEFNFDTQLNLFEHRIDLRITALLTIRYLPGQKLQPVFRDQSCEQIGPHSFQRVQQAMAVSCRRERRSERASTSCSASRASIP